jgi:uncharacterized protein (DUF1501 family)
MVTKTLPIVKGCGSAQLSMGNLPFTTDFRAVYATVLERWLGRLFTPIVGGSFATLPVLA